MFIDIDVLLLDLTFQNTEIHKRNKLTNKEFE